ncbi:LacI family transcriptional regulator [Echinicola strongylocentroti]|uniref:LacI family transcriptional regulator n=1 Tax=Echinicola strongylocentroti TaxID=1795355 RepID=A0A2Z4INE1_9BACT|nr:LacI family DNA-binding transcriptional regulator [Echinicola strongylocentroti]AWW32602.1 LacI family transcriptional regulator [Echinicola strongylocentroti]
MSEKHQLTLKDIAKELGLAVSTVSRALKSHPDISEETIKLVKDYAEKHHYVPNLLAVNFRKSKTFNIGLIIPELVHQFFSSIISGVLSESNAHGYNVMICQSNEHVEDEKKVAKALLNSRVDGVIISLSNETTEVAHLEEFLAAEIPVVQVDKIIETFDTPKVIVNDFSGAHQAVTELIKKGYHKVAHIRGRLNVQHSNERFRGYAEALKEHGKDYPDSYVKICKDLTKEEGYEFAKSLMESKNPPDAIFCVTDLVALGVMQYLKQHHIHVPDEVGVIGFSNWQLGEIISPTLSTVHQPGFELGEKATSLLIEKINNGLASPNEQVVLDADLIVRESVRS